MLPGDRGLGLSVRRAPGRDVRGHHCMYMFGETLCHDEATGEKSDVRVRHACIGQLGSDRGASHNRRKGPDQIG